MANTSPLPDQLIYLIIRFASSIPDLTLSIPSPLTTSTLSLKQLIRPHLPLSNAYARLRLIYAGKVLPDTAPLATSLRLPPPLRRDRDRIHNEQGKGKQAVRHGEGDAVALPAVWQVGTIPPDAKRYYIHCSLGDALSITDLASETTLARATDEALKSQYLSSNTSSTRPPIGTASSTSSHDKSQRRSSTAANTAPEPQGFDRLLSSGFTPAEVAQLRTHFQTNLSYTHTPDTMPSASAQRALEDRWLDSTANDPSVSSSLPGEGGTDGGGGWGAGFAVEEGGLDDMLWGYLTGFFWPLGALIWGFREEGVWTRRRQVAVVMGVVLNAAFGFMRWSQ